MANVIAMLGNMFAFKGTYQAEVSLATDAQLRIPAPQPGGFPPVEPHDVLGPQPVHGALRASDGRELRHMGSGVPHTCLRHPDDVGLTL